MKAGNPKPNEKVESTATGDTKAISAIAQLAAGQGDRSVFAGFPA